MAEARQHNVSGREWNGISRMGMTRNMQPAIRFPLQRKNNALHGNLRPSYNLPAVFAVIKTEPIWPDTVSRQTRNLYFIAVLRGDGRWVSCAFCYLGSGRLESRSSRGTFRQPAVTSVRANNKRRCKCPWFSMLIYFAVCISRAASN